MNEQIKNLVLQNRDIFHNGVTEVNGEIYIHGSQSNLEKFAELIVRDCLNIIEKSCNVHNKSEAAKMEATRIHGKISDRFGIE